MKCEWPAAGRKKWEYRIFKGAAAAENRRTAPVPKKSSVPGAVKGAAGSLPEFLWIAPRYLSGPG
jgi:hypothetical protein